MRARDLDASKRVITAFLGSHGLSSVERLLADVTLARRPPSTYRNLSHLTATRETYLGQLHEFHFSLPS